MALSKDAIGKIKSFVQSTKRLLMKEFAAQIQQHYGIRLDGSYSMVEELTTKDGSIIQTARLLRERLSYLESTIAGTNKKEEAVEQLIREQAFTILNRFAAIRMAEERNIIPETIKQGYNSEGFQVFDQLSGGAQTAEQFERYTWFLNAMFDELAIDLPAVFDRFSPYALLFPSEKVMLELLDIIDDEDLNIYREEGQQPINLWEEDETIGWIYQYYNSREEISAMREASGAPRNSRELAVRNQFFTPRYVVQFLVDNSLGRQWFEMTKGQTVLVNDCQYMVKREQEIFLDKGEAIPEAKIERANYIEYRALKDPREILMLDPACGSMHFGLYCFDLFEQIYIEAWDMQPELMLDLRDKYLREEYIKRIPGYILQYNIHGVDIDPRAIQIAGLSLWLRAQKSYKKLGLQPADRPMIKKSNLVVAEPMPGDAGLLSEFTSSLPGPIGKLVRVIWDKMHLAGETGLLLKIEEELKKEIEIAKKEYKQYKGGSTQTSIFGGVEDAKAAEMAAIYGKDQKITKDFFDTAEEEVLKALQSFSENAEGEHAFQKLLFAEDTARGFAFIELCRKRYDVIVMNPPFGASAISSKDYIKDSYQSANKNILCGFFERMNGILEEEGNVAAIFDNTVSLRGTFEEFRKNFFCGKIKYVLDTGWDVLDANVETTSNILSKNKFNNSGIFIDVRNSDNKAQSILDKIRDKDYVLKNSMNFLTLPNAIIGYYFHDYVIEYFNNKTFELLGFKVLRGFDLLPERHHWLFWEIPNMVDYKILYNGSKHSHFYTSIREVAYFGKNGEKVSSIPKVSLSNFDKAFEPGVCYGKRGEILDVQILRKNIIFTHEGKAIPGMSEIDALVSISYLNSSFAQWLINQYCGQHKQGIYLNQLPFKVPDDKNDCVKYVIDAANIKRKYVCCDETTLEFLGILQYFTSNTFENSIKVYLEEYKKDLFQFEVLIEKNDEYWKQFLNLPVDIALEIENFKSRRPTDLFFLNEVESNLEQSLCKEIISSIVGIVFNRWDLNLMELAKYQDDYELFESLSKYPKPLINNSDKESISFYPETLFINKMRKLINDLWNDDVVSSLEQILNIRDFDSFINASSGFFNFHIKRYTKGRSVAPIYWPLSTESNSYVVWVYYPELNENSLFKIVNELVDPKLDDIKELVIDLERAGTSKDLHEQMALRDELIDFKEELLRVAQLPYKPNQDDGVLITAAPLYNLFRHNKWRKSTEACWKKLEKGEYDWAHLAYSIWPDRVANKCKKDLSMAIAHGLESICEIKPKEKKTRKKPEIKVEAQNKLI